MVKTTVYLPDELKARLERFAREEGKSEAEVIRDAVDRHTVRAWKRPTLPLFKSGDPLLAENVDEYLGGFGQD